VRQRPMQRRLLVAVLTVAAIATLASEGGLAQEATPSLETQVGAKQLTSRVDDRGRRTTIMTGDFWIRRGTFEAEADTAYNYEWREQYELLGNVHAKSDSLEVWSRRLKLYEKDDSARAWGDVRIATHDGIIGSGDFAVYRKPREWLALVGGARVIDGLLIVSADSISVFRTTGKMQAFGNVRVVDEESSTVITGEHGRFDRSTGIAVVDSVPRLISRGQGGEATEVESHWMAFDRKLGRSTAIGDVRFRQGSTNATADTAQFYGESLLVMTGAPIVDYERRRITGETIRLHYLARKIRMMEVFGQADLNDATPDTLASTFRSIPLANTLSGDSLRVFLEHGEVTRTFVRGNAKSVYLPEDQERAVSANEVQGESIDISFIEGLVHRVQVNGNVLGNYRFYERAKTAADTAVAATDSLGAAVDSVVVAPPDSLSSLAVDSMATAAVDTSLIDFVANADEVLYQGDSTTFLVQDGEIRIDGAAQVDHGTLRLTSQTIRFDTDRRELLAEGDPLLVDRDSKIVGDKMGYLFDPQTGAVSGGATQFDDGYYEGKHIRRIDKHTMLIEQGRYTTCDLQDPHYHFNARRMKLVVGERVVARQITLRLSNIPLITLPFYYKSLKSGRRSGVLFPSFDIGIDSRDGRFVRDFGYYWATNDYTDLMAQFGYYERRRFTTKLRNRYNFRYGMRGNVTFDYTKQFEDRVGGLVGDEWQLKANHSHPNLLDVWSARADISASSKNLTRNEQSQTSNEQLLPTELRSTASVGRRFDNGSNLSLSAGRTQQVYNGDTASTDADELLYTQYLPRASLSFKTLPLAPQLRPGEQGNPLMGVLRDTQFSQSYRGSWDREAREITDTDRLSTGGNLGLRWAPPSVGPLKLSSSGNFSDTYTYTHTSVDSLLSSDGVTDPPRTITEDEQNQISLAVNTTLATDIYGLFDAHVGAVRGMKHKVSMSATHSLRPAIREQQLRSQNFSFGLKQEFSVKVADDRAPPDERSEESETEEEPTRKLDQVVVWDLGSSYNPDAEPDRRWGTIDSRVSVKSPIPQIRSIQVTQSVDPYSFEIQRTQVTSGLTLSGGLPLGGQLVRAQEPKNHVIERIPSPADSNAADKVVGEDAEDFFDNEDLRGSEDPWARPDLEETGDRNILSWWAQSNITYIQSRESTGSSSTRATVSASAGIELPGSWRFDYGGGFDIEVGSFVNQRFNLTRDLHQWEMSFSRTVVDGPSETSGSEFSFSLRLKEIPDLKVERGQTGAGSGLNRFGQY